MFQIQVDVLIRRLVFQDHYLNHEVSRNSIEIINDNQEIILHSLQFDVWHRMRMHLHVLLIQRFRFHIVLNVIHRYGHHDHYEKL